MDAPVHRPDEPILGFHRETEDERITCLFNLSPHKRRLSVAGTVEAIGPGSPAPVDGVLDLPPNGWAWLRSTGASAPEIGVLPAPIA